MPHILNNSARNTMTESLYQLLIKENPSTDKGTYNFRLTEYNKKLEIYFSDKRNHPNRTDVNRITSERLEEITREEFAGIKIRCDFRQYGDGDFEVEFIPVSADFDSQKYSDHYMRLSERLSQLTITLHTGNKSSRSLPEKQRIHYHDFIMTLINEYITVGQTRAEEKKAVLRSVSK